MTSAPDKKRGWKLGEFKLAGSNKVIIYHEDTKTRRKDKKIGLNYKKSEIELSEKQPNKQKKPL